MTNLLIGKLLSTQIIKMEYYKSINYLGSNQKHKQYTNYLYKRYSGLNRTAFNHDKYYSSMLEEDHLFYALIWKFCFDFMFLIMGTLRSIARLQLGGVPLAVIFFIAILVYTPIYLKKHYKPSERF